MKQFERFLACLALMFATTAFATEHSQPSNIRVKCNEHGAVITDASGQKTYLGKDCDAYQPNVGSGSWWLTASAFAFEINGKTALLPVEVDCDLPACGHNG